MVLHWRDHNTQGFNVNLGTSGLFSSFQRLSWGLCTAGEIQTGKRVCLHISHHAQHTTEWFTVCFLIHVTLNWFMAHWVVDWFTVCDMNLNGLPKVSWFVPHNKHIMSPWLVDWFTVCNMNLIFTSNFSVHVTHMD